MVDEDVEDEDTDDDSEDSEGEEDDIDEDGVDEEDSEDEENSEDDEENLGNDEEDSENDEEDLEEDEEDSDPSDDDVAATPTHVTFQVTDSRGRVRSDGLSISLGSTLEALASLLCGLLLPPSEGCDDHLWMFQKASAAYEDNDRYRQRPVITLRPRLGQVIEFDYDMGDTTSATLLVIALGGSAGSSATARPPRPPPCPGCVACDAEHPYATVEEVLENHEGRQAAAAAAPAAAAAAAPPPTLDTLFPALAPPCARPTSPWGAPPAPPMPPCALTGTMAAMGTCCLRPGCSGMGMSCWWGRRMPWGPPPCCSATRGS